MNLQRAIQAIDAANAADPHTVLHRGARLAKEVLHAQLAGEWVRRLCPAPSPALQLAARAHHIRRWEIPRTAYAAGRRGYLQWRRAAARHHQQVAGALLAECGVAAETIAETQALIGKRRLGSCAEAQTLEDALCLVFLETQLAALAQRLGCAHAAAVLCKTIRKMSPQALQLSRALQLPPAAQSVFARALQQAALQPEGERQ